MPLITVSLTQFPPVIMDLTIRGMTLIRSVISLYLGRPVAAFQVILGFVFQLQ